ncbi:polyketide synthase [Lecanosticta acicola]|uniref:Polyketide synthase n=1 Tax=Lecanosticta acicola TaxID=111012 RepID=A0AAI9EDB3_9PEZI|nr:polyketide synthase [Lecanosticta acicola]
MIDATEPLAIIGLATRFPDDADSTENLWKFLLDKRCAHSPFPADKIGAGHYHPDPEHGGTFAVKGGHFLKEDSAYFDAPFFSITKGEAQSLDPQQRVVLENVYLALENGGLAMEKVAGSNTCVFVSGFNHDHLAILNSDPETTLRHRVTGLTNSMHSNRVSWFFDFRGPSVTIDTACSSSMAALHLGAQSLRTGESDMAVVTGVTIINYPGDVAGMSHQGFLSPDGRCFSFDHRANGFARGEGVGTVIVKRLSAALKDGDTIRAVVRGTGINQDGHTPGLTLPSSDAQSDLIKAAYASAGLDFDQTMFVEAHGTGTKQGDAIEARGIAQAFASRRKDKPLYVGSVKASIGHLEGAAGVAGIVKSVLALEHGIIPPQANFEKPNPKIRFDAWNLHIPRDPTPWPCDGLRRVSVNSFGVGGTNSHAILDDAYHFLKEHGLSGRHHTTTVVPSPKEIDKHAQRPSIEPDEMTNGESVNDSEASTIITNGHHSHRQWQLLDEIASPPQLVGISAFDEEGVRRSANAQAEHLAKNKRKYTQGPDLVRDFAFTMHKRSQLGWRSSLMAFHGPGLSESLSSQLTKPVRARGTLSVAFVFTGQGAQYAGMSRELHGYPVFRRSLEEASFFFRSLGAEWSLIDELSKSEEDTQIHEPWLAQPACTAIQVAMVDLLRSWNILPARVIGHSSGEIAAGYSAGKLNRESAWRVAYYRGIVSSTQTAVKGTMAAVALSQPDAQARLDELNKSGDGKAVVACINSQRNCTVSGDEHIVSRLCQTLQEESIFARKLNITKAYHSHHMEAIAKEYHAMLQNITPGEPNKTQMFSTVTGALAEEEVLNGEYWVKNLISPVRFSDGLSTTLFRAAQKGQASLKIDSSAGNVFVDTIVELGTHGALQSAIKDILASQPGASIITSHALLNRSKPGAESLLSTVGHLWSRGYPVNLQLVNESWDAGHAPRKPSLLVDLPGYVFNHSQKLWYESRLSRNHRLRKEPRHDLFGAPVADWNSEAPRWRNFLRLGEQPWLRDHLVTDSYVYPGVGYIIAAVEAMRQIAHQDLEITGFRLKEISIKRALIVPDGKEGVEVMLSMARVDESSVGVSSTWRRFQIDSYNPLGDEWIEHCTGYIAVDYDAPTGPVDGGREAGEEAKARKEQLLEAEARCQGSFDIERAYENMASNGLNFGPLFRNGSETTGTGSRGGAVLGKVTVPDVAKAMPKGHMSPHLIHPATMDSMMHFALGAIMDFLGGETLEGPAVPTFIEEVWMSADLHSEPGAQYRVHGRTKRVAFEKYDNDVLAWDAGSGDARVAILGIRATPLDSADQQVSLARELCHDLTWVPYLETITLADVQCNTRVSQAGDLTTEWVQRLQLATMLLVHDALQELNKADPPVVPEGHLARYLEWLEQLDKWMQEDQVSGMSKSDFDQVKDDAAAKKTLFNQIEGYKAEGRLAYRMGSNIVKVLKKEVDPLHLMFGQDDILDHVYADLVDLGDLPGQQAQFLQILADNRTNLRVLEIGAGTGSSTKAIIETLAPLAEDGRVLRSSVVQYTYTDISAAFFEKAREKLKAYHGIMDYKVLDAEKDVGMQGFDLGSYDLIVAQNVIHATADLKSTLTNLRKLMKPGGRFLIQEGMRQDYFWSALAFGQLPGWWLGSEGARRWSPFVPASEWNALLRASGFSGVELEMPNSLEPALHTQSLMLAGAIATADAASREGSWEETAIITSLPAVQTSDGLISRLRAGLATVLGTQKIAILHLDQLKDADLSRTLCISVVELERSALASPTVDEYEGIRRMLTVCKGLLWVTADDIQNPNFGMATGLLRTVRWERDLDGVNLVTLSIAEPKPDVEALSESIAGLCRIQFAGALTPQETNGEYTLTGGKLITTRLKDSAGANGFLASKFSTPKPVMMPWKDAGRPVKLSSASPGLLHKLEWVTDPVYNMPLDPTHVEIEIKAMGLNFRDLMIAMGEHMAISIGCEASGVISRVGPEVTDVKVGDRVAYITGLHNVGCFHTRGRVDQSVVTKIPDELSYEEAAGLPAVYVTVLYALRDVARLAQGERVLIHAAAGGVGQAAINYAKHILVEEHGILEDHIFSSRDLSFAKGVRRMTGGEGVDVVLNSLAGDALRASWALLAPFGRFIEIGKKDIQANSKLELRPLLHATSITCVDLVSMMSKRPLLVKRLTDDTVRLWSEGVVKPARPTTVWPLSKLQEGFQLLQSGKGVGKMVFVPQPDDIVPIVPAQPPQFQLNPDATYVLSGGLGGLGRSIAGWMAGRGARHFLFLSSSGTITAAVADMKSDLEASGCKVHIVKCDVSDAERLKVVLEESKTAMPPIKGLVQGAMKLQDSIFENMSYEAYMAAVNPKVPGSWNLHTLLPGDLDHFVMLSSATGILGNRGQSNYAAGNTFQDALAHHRRSRGLAASTIDVGAILSVGYVAEHAERVTINKGISVELERIREEELHAMIEYAMDSRHKAAAQIVTGLSNRDRYRKKGMPTPTFMDFPLFAHLNAQSVNGAASSGEDSSVAVETLLGVAKTLSEAASIVTDAVVAKLASLLSVSADDIDADKSVSANGIDSLVAMEFRTFLVRDVKADVPMLDIMGTSSIKVLSKKIASLSRAVAIGEEESKTEGSS